MRVIGVKETKGHQKMLFLVGGRKGNKRRRTRNGGEDNKICPRRRWKPCGGPMDRRAQMKGARSQ